MPEIRLPSEEEWIADLERKRDEYLSRAHNEIKIEPTAAPEFLAVQSANYLRYLMMEHLLQNGSFDTNSFQESVGGEFDGAAGLWYVAAIPVLEKYTRDHAFLKKNFKS